MCVCVSELKPFFKKTSFHCFLLQMNLSFFSFFSSHVIHTRWKNNNNFFSISKHHTHTHIKVCVCRVSLNLCFLFFFCNQKKKLKHINDRNSTLFQMQFIRINPYKVAQFAFKILMIHFDLRFTLRITFHCVLHRLRNQDIHQIR